MDHMNQERSVKVIPFRGLDGEWREWSAKFLAKANLQGFKGILLGDIPVPPENIENRMQKEIAREYNMYAYSSLILCCTGVPFSIVDGAKTVELPSGDARLAWEALKVSSKQSFRPTGAIRLTESIAPLAGESGTHTIPRVPIRPQPAEAGRPPGDPPDLSLHKHSRPFRHWRNASTAPTAG